MKSMSVAYENNKFVFPPMLGVRRFISSTVHRSFPVRRPPHFYNLHGHHTLTHLRWWLFSELVTFVSVPELHTILPSSEFLGGRPLF
jgi:hypothetical protein